MLMFDNACRIAKHASFSWPLAPRCFKAIHDPLTKRSCHFTLHTQVMTAKRVKGVRSVVFLFSFAFRKLGNPRRKSPDMDRLMSAYAGSNVGILVKVGHGLFFSLLRTTLHALCPTSDYWNNRTHGFTSVRSDSSTNATRVPYSICGSNLNGDRGDPGQGEV